MKYKNEHVPFLAQPIRLYEECHRVKEEDVRLTLSDILLVLGRETVQINGEWVFQSEGFYPLEGASKRLGRDTTTIKRHLIKLQEMGWLTFTKKSKAYKSGQKHCTTYVRILK